MSAFTESKLNSDLVSKAVSALLKYEAKKAGQGSKGKALLMSNYAKPILVQVQLFKNVSRPVTKPTRVKIPHSLFDADEEDNTICLFCKSDEKESISQYLEKHPIKGLTTVISINDAKKHYVQFKDKKSLLNAHTHFICDSRIAGQLYNILGSTFSARSDYPVQINFSNPAQLPGLVQKVVDSTYFHLAGNNLSIRLGHTAMPAAAVTANILEGLPFAVEKLQNGWADVHSVHLKTSDSAALPIYTKGDSEMMTYVATQAAQLPSSTAPAVAAAAAVAPSKGKKATPVPAKAPAEPLASAAAPTPVKENKKRKAESAQEVASTTAPEPAASSSTTAAAPKSAAKKTKTDSAVTNAPALAAAAVEVPPQSAKKGTAKKAPAAASVVEAVAPEEKEEVAAPKSAAKTTAKKTPAKATASTAAAAPVVLEEPTPRKSARRAAATPAAAQEESAAAPAATPAGRTSARRAVSARK